MHGVQDIKDWHGALVALGNLANLYRRTEDIDGACFYFKQAVTISRQIGEVHAGAGVSFNFALLLDTMGRRKEAIKFAEYAMLIYMFMDHEEQVHMVQEHLHAWGWTWNDDIIPMFNNPPPIPEDL